MYIIIEALLFINLCSVLIICCLCSILVHIIHHKNKNDTKDVYTQINLQSDIPLLIIHPNNDIDIANNSQSNLHIHDIPP